MTPKQALAKWNEANPTKAIKFSEGRGRLSREAVAKCTELAGTGWSIAGYQVTADSSSPQSQTVVKVAQTNEKVVQDFVILYDERAYAAFDRTGKVWSMRNCCNTCRVSLVQCHCGSPSIFGDIAVTIKPHVS